MKDVPISQWVYNYSCTGRYTTVGNTVMGLKTERISKPCGWQKQFKGIGTGPNTCPECKGVVASTRVK